MKLHLEPKHFEAMNKLQKEFQMAYERVSKVAEEWGCWQFLVLKGLTYSSLRKTTSLSSSLCKNVAYSVTVKSHCQTALPFFIAEIQCSKSYPNGIVIPLGNSEGTRNKGILATTESHVDVGDYLFELKDGSWNISSLSKGMTKDTPKVIDKTPKQVDDSELREKTREFYEDCIKNNAGEEVLLPSYVSKELLVEMYGIEILKDGNDITWQVPLQKSLKK